jgi:hypothetical protein
MRGGLMTIKEIEGALRACMVAAPRMHHIANLRTHIATLARKLREAQRTIRKLKKERPA